MNKTIRFLKTENEIIELLNDGPNADLLTSTLKSDCVFVHDRLDEGHLHSR